MNHHFNVTTPPSTESTSLNQSANINGFENLLLINRNNKIPEKYLVDLNELPNKQYVDSPIVPFLQKMFDDMRSQGMCPVVVSGYRTHEKQQMFMDNAIDALLSEGLSLSEAKAEALKWVSVAGYSEHQTGLAVDINADNGNKEADANKIYSWLAKHSWKYGFILRYPENKAEITHISYEPWHYRFVGIEAAKNIFDKKLCLEEYLDIHAAPNYIKETF